jgi:hypothetical protein
LAKKVAVPRWQRRARNGTFVTGGVLLLPVLDGEMIKRKINKHLPALPGAA